MVGYSHLFKNFPHFFVIHTVKDFSVVNEAEVDILLEFSCFFYEPTNVGNLISGASVFSNELTLHIRWPKDWSFSFSFLTCIQVSQETGEVVWYFQLFKNFPEFVVMHIVKGFSKVNETEVDVFLELTCFFNDPVDVGNLISGSSAFSKSSLYIWKFLPHILLKPSLKDF